MRAQPGLQEAAWESLARVLGPVSAPEPEPVLNWKRVVGDAPVVDRLTDKPWYTTNSWPALLPNDTFVGV